MRDLLAYVEASALDVLSKDALYWTFSTVAQATVAIVAFVGVLVVWKLQIVQDQRRSARTELRNWLSSHVSRRGIAVVTEDEAIRRATDLIGQEQAGDSIIDSGQAAFLTELVEDLHEARRVAANTTAPLVGIARWGISTAVLAIVLLPFTGTLAASPALSIPATVAVIGGVLRTADYGRRLLRETLTAPS